VTLLRCLLVLGVLAIPIAATWYFAEPVFLLLGVDEAVCVVMRGYLRVRLFSLPADVVNLSFSK
jgi:Na+-driven multidrug efflux pump